MALILASASPRRKELLSFITSDFIIKVSGAEEKTEPGLTPGETVESLAEQKAAEIRKSSAYDDIIISADTVVSINGKILGKPHSHAEAKEMISLLSGRHHEVYTGVCILHKDRKEVFHERTDVEFYELTEDEILGYINTDEPYDKAGAYGIQGKGALLVKGICGDFYNVMGFPVSAVKRVLDKITV